jgi:peptidoglycan hydrolase-like protein with peptidoglycan-binding domain
MGRLSRSAGGDRRAWTVVLAVLIVPVLALAAWAAVRSFPDPTAAGRAVEALIVPVTSADQTPSAMVTVTVENAEGRSVTSSGSGTVTRAPKVGTTLDDGDVALRVDDRPVRAMVSDAPLWRSLSRGDRGDDVARLQEYLAATGYRDAPPDGVFGPGTQSAVAAFNRDAGLPRTAVAFDPATVLWVGPRPMEVAVVGTSEGTQVSPGTVVLTGPQRAGVVTVAEEQGGIGPDFADGATLLVGEVAVPYVAGSGHVDDPDDVATVAAALAPQSTGTAQIVADDEQRVRVVPASAIVTGADGTTCVYPQVGAAPVVVQAVGGGSSSVQLDESVDLESVVANPHLVDLEVPCSS